MVKIWWSRVFDVPKKLVVITKKQSKFNKITKISSHLFEWMNDSTTFYLATAQNGTGSKWNIKMLTILHADTQTRPKWKYSYWNQSFVAILLNKYDQSDGNGTPLLSFAYSHKFHNLIFFVLITRINNWGDTW